MSTISMSITEADFNIIIERAKRNAHKHIETVWDGKDSRLKPTKELLSSTIYDVTQGHCQLFRLNAPNGDLNFTGRDLFQLFNSLDDRIVTLVEAIFPLEQQSSALKRLLRRAAAWDPYYDICKVVQQQRTYSWKKDEPVKEKNVSG